MRLFYLAVMLHTAKSQFPRTPSFYELAYQTPDGQQRQQITDPFGFVRGLYSYVDPAGHTVSVKYNTPKPSGFASSFFDKSRFLNSPSLIPRISIPALQESYVPQSGELPEQVPRFPDFNSTSSAVELRSPPSAESLFRPSLVPYPAETTGQMDEFKKALQEIAQEDANALQDLNISGAVGSTSTTSRPSSFVTVNFGTNNYAYSV